jgi:hypothetical protein
MKILAASALAIGRAAVSASQAMPIAPLGTSQGGSETAIQVAGGCGPGWHRGPYGGCRPLYNCPPGWHPGPVRQALLPQRLVGFGENRDVRGLPFAIPAFLIRRCGSCSG